MAPPPHWARRIGGQDAYPGTPTNVAAGSCFPSSNAPRHCSATLASVDVHHADSHPYAETPERHWSRRNAARRGTGTHGRCGGPAGFGSCAGGLGPCARAPAQAPSERASAQAASERAAERLRALQEEADSLLARERTLLTDLRRLEVDRAMAAERLSQIETETTNLEQELADTARHRELLEQARAAEAPILRNRLVELYKLGGGGYLRLLLGVDDLRDVGRAYRTVSALAALDRERARAHESTLKSLAQVEADLTARQSELAKLHEEAVATRAAADRAVRERTGLIARIDQRRDLNAQLTGELQAAQARLQQTVSDLGGNATVLPLRPFQGTLSWPVTGRVLTHVRLPSDGAPPGASPQNGIEIAAPPGTPVTAVHDGTVAFAGPFEGFGTS